MKTRIYSAVLALVLSSTVVVLAQNAPTQNQPAPAEQNSQMGTQNRGVKMDMSTMMDCCKTMQEKMKSSEKMECPMMSGTANGLKQPPGAKQ